MTKKKDKKRHIRAEAERTGKSYATVRAEVKRREGTSAVSESGSVHDALRVWCLCVQAVGWLPFAKSTEDLFEYYTDVLQYADEEMDRLLEGAGVPPDTSETIRALAQQAAEAAGRRDAQACLAGLERADVLLTQAGWGPIDGELYTEWVGSDYEVDVAERLAEGPLVAEMRNGKERRTLVLALDQVYRIRGNRDQQPAAGRLCRLIRFDHHVPGEALVRYLDSHRFGVFQIHELEESSPRDKTLASA